MRRVSLRPLIARPQAAPRAECIHHLQQLSFGNQFHLFQSRVKCHLLKARSHKIGQYALQAEPRLLILV